MSNRLEIDIRDVTRVIFSGTAAYLAVHFLVLPQLVSIGVTFPTYFYIGVAVTAVFSVAMSVLATRYLGTRGKPAKIHPAQ